MISCFCRADRDLGLTHFPSAHTRLSSGLGITGIGSVFGPGVPFGMAGGRTRGIAGSGKGGIECAAAAAIVAAILNSTRVGP